MIPNTIEIAGGFLVLQNDSHISKWQIECQHLCHDAFLPKVATNCMKKGDYVLDLGAFSGDHTIAYSDAVGETGHVFAIEAGSLAFQCLKHNIALFKHQNVTAEQWAVNDGSVNVMTHIEDPNLGASFCGSEGGNGKPVHTIQIDELVRNWDIRKLDFIKMDIEGGEIRALRGAVATLKHFRPKMLLEVSSTALARQGFNKWHLLAEVINQGYSFKIVEPQCTLESPEFNIICEPL